MVYMRLNGVAGQTPEYFSAVVLFTGDFAFLPFFSIEKANISRWITCYKNISETHPEKEVREKLAKSLVNAT